MSIKPKELHPIDNRSWIVSLIKDWVHGEPPKLVGRAAISGTYSPQTKAKVTTRLKSVLEMVSIGKIGVMGDTAVRMDDKVYRKSFAFVQRVYKTKSQ